MKPIIRIVGSDELDGHFARLFEKILQHDADQIPDNLWLLAYQDIMEHQCITATTERAILNHFKASG